jgi:hypothetical protein
MGNSVNTTTPTEFGPRAESRESDPSHASRFPSSITSAFQRFSLAMYMTQPLYCDRAAFQASTTARDLRAGFRRSRLTQRLTVARSYRER